jgi:hypothetical protein
VTSSSRVIFAAAATTAASLLASNLRFIFACMALNALKIILAAEVFCTELARVR